MRKVCFQQMLLQQLASVWKRMNFHPLPPITHKINSKGITDLNVRTKTSRSMEIYRFNHEVIKDTFIKGK